MSKNASLRHRIRSIGLWMPLAALLALAPVARAGGEAAVSDPVYTPLMRLARQIDAAAGMCGATGCPDVDCAAYGELRTAIATIQFLLGPTEWLSLYGQSVEKWDGAPRRLEGDTGTLGYWIALAREDATAHYVNVDRQLIASAERRGTVERAVAWSTFATDVSKLFQTGADILSLKDFLVEKGQSMVLNPDRISKPATLMSDISDMMELTDGLVAFVELGDLMQRKQQELAGAAEANGFGLPDTVQKATTIFGMTNDLKGALPDIIEARALAAEAVQSMKDASDLLRSPIVASSGEAFRAGLARRGEIAAAAQAKAASDLLKADELRRKAGFGIAQLALKPATMFADYQIAKLTDELNELAEVMAAEERAVVSASLERVGKAQRNEALMQAMEALDAAVARLEACADSCPDVLVAVPQIAIPVGSFHPGPDRKASWGVAIPWFEGEIARYAGAASAALERFRTSRFEAQTVELTPVQSPLPPYRTVEIGYGGSSCLLRNGMVERDDGWVLATQPKRGYASFPGHETAGVYAYRFLSPRGARAVTVDVRVEADAEEAAFGAEGAGQLAPRIAGPFEAKCGDEPIVASIAVSPRWSVKSGTFNVFWFTGARNERDMFQSNCPEWSYLDQKVNLVRVTFSDGTTLESESDPRAEFAIPAGAGGVSRIEIDYGFSADLKWTLVWNFGG